MRTWIALFRRGYANIALSVSVSGTYFYIVKHHMKTHILRDYSMLSGTWHWTSYWCICSCILWYIVCWGIICEALKAMHHTSSQLIGSGLGPSHKVKNKKAPASWRRWIAGANSWRSFEKKSQASWKKRCSSQVLHLCRTTSRKGMVTWLKASGVLWRLVIWNW